MKPDPWYSLVPVRETTLIDPTLVMLVEGSRLKVEFGTPAPSPVRSSGPSRR